MSTAASLALLKGGTKSALDAELEKEPVAETPPAPAAENVVDIDVMTGPQLDALCKEHEVEVPDTWKKMTVAKKKEWLKTQFEETTSEPALKDQSQYENPTPEDVAESQAELAGEAAAEASTQSDAEVTAEIVGMGGAADPEAHTAEVDAAALEPTTEAGKQVAVADKAAKKTKPAKGKAVAVASIDGDIVEPDVLVDLVHEIENMKEQDARNLVGTLTEQAEVTFFKLGGILSVIMSNKWFDPYPSFKEYVEKEHGIGYHRATYWVGIYNDLVAAGVPWDKVKSIGWTKLKEIAKVITNENVDEWVALATKMNTISLIETVKAHLNKDKPKALEDQAAATVTTKTFKVHADQKVTIEAAIEKAKGISGTSVDTAALEFICLDYLGGQSMVGKFKGMGIEAVLASVEKAFPNAKIDVELTET